MDPHDISGERLTSWSVAPDGEQVRLGFEDEAGRPCAVTLPIAVLSALMMTIPRMLRQALEARFADGSLRMIQELSLATPDGFEVTFAVATPQADRLGETLRHSAAPSAARAPVVN